MCCRFGISTSGYLCSQIVLSDRLKRKHLLGPLVTVCLNICHNMLEGNVKEMQQPQTKPEHLLRNTHLK